MSMFLRFKFKSPYQCLLLVGRKWFRNWRNFQMGQKRYFFSLHTLESRTTRQPFYRRRLYYPRASGQLPLERSGMYCEESIHLWIIVSRCLHISYTSFLFIIINFQYIMLDWNLNKKKNHILKVQNVFTCKLWIHIKPTFDVLNFADLLQLVFYISFNRAYGEITSTSGYWITISHKNI